MGYCHFTEFTWSIFTQQILITFLAGIILQAASHQFGGGMIHIIQVIVYGVYNINRRIGFIQNIILQAAPVLGGQQQFPVCYYIPDFCEKQFRIAGNMDHIVRSYGQVHNFI